MYPSTSGPAPSEENRACMVRSPVTTTTMTTVKPRSMALLAMHFNSFLFLRITLREMSEVAPIPSPWEMPFINITTGKVKLIAANCVTPSFPT